MRLRALQHLQKTMFLKNVVPLRTIANNSEHVYTRSAERAGWGGADRL